MVQSPSKEENGPEPAQEQTKGMMSFLHSGITKFISRQGNPRSMWSNNGKYFVRANQELKFSLKNLD